MYGKMQESGLPEIIPLLAPQLLGPVTCASHPESPQGTLLCGKEAAVREGCSLYPEFPQGSCSGVAVVA